ncbi:MAG: ABC transporter permease [Renibacterium salmoninarum]|nr:ABC transporter permease [Renibacterium salmoninarum]
MSTLTQAINPATARLKNHVSLQQTIRNSFTMAWRGLLKIKRTPEQLLDVTLQPILFTVMCSAIFGGAIAGSVEQYLPYMLPGILVQTVITTSVVTGVQLREDMDKGVFDRFKSLPIARIAPLAGALLADTLRYAIGTTLTFATGFVMGYRAAGGVGNVILAGLLVVVCSWAVSWIFAFFGVIARTAASVQGISFLVLFPLTFLSNAYVRPESMPPFLEAFVNVNPLSFLISGLRDLTNDGVFSSNAWFALIGAAAIVLVFAPLTVRAYMRKA